jgi:hypothetical protein
MIILVLLLMLLLVLLEYYDNISVIINVIISIIRIL